MIEFVGNHFRHNLVDSFYERNPEQICSLLKALHNEVYRARTDAYKQIVDLFDRYPNRVYGFEWPEAYEWDSELLSQCPYISYRTDEVLRTSTNYIPHGRFVYDGYVREIYVSNGEIMVDARYDTIPLADVLEIELILEALIGAKDYQKGLSKNGFYYKEV